jgi:hypothetical protein
MLPRKKFKRTQMNVLREKQHSIKIKNHGTHEEIPIRLLADVLPDSIAARHVGFNQRLTCRVSKHGER